MSLHFHPLRIREVRRETADCVSVAFDVPPELRDQYRFSQGQHLTLRAQVDGRDERRSYSICSGVGDYEGAGELRVAVKRVPNGAFSTFVQSLQPGQKIAVLPPAGNFFVPLDPSSSRHYVAFVAGSGITPVMSLLRTTLSAEPRSRFTVVYGNRSADSIIFCEQLEDLKNRYLDRLRLYHVLSRERQEIELFNGRIDAAKVAEFLRTLIPPGSIDHAFVCGPATMIDEVERALVAAGVPPQRVHVERFGVPVPADAAAAAAAAAVAASGPRDERVASLTVILDGKQRVLPIGFAGTSVLDTALAAGLDLPYACKGGVCCTCRAKLLEGEVWMDKNFALEPAEVERGFVLTCQSHPLTDRIVVSYDER